MHKTIESEILESEIPVLVEFFANWCAPCKLMKPVIEELKKDFNGSIKCIRIDIEKHQKLADTFGVLTLPTFSVYKNGKKVKEVTGIQTKKRLLAFLR